ncbi:MAG: creatininase family protein, partial [Rhodospirillaceae bacterium]
IEKMTWPELKAALAAGKTTALFYTGGTEQRGPQNIIAGHNAIGREVVKHIAEKLGNAIAMPVLPFTPTNANPETPGDISLPADTLGIVLENVSEQAIANGFKNVVLMGDSGGGQGPTGVYAGVAKKLDDKYGAKGVHVYYADSPYIAARDAFNKILAEKGLPVGQHGGIQDTSEMMYLETLPGNADWVRKDKLPITEGVPVVNGKATPGPNSPHNGITGDARKSSVELGKLRHEMKVDYAVRQIQGFIAPKK